MEDRVTPGLYLEMTDLSPPEYVSRRVSDVLKLAEVERATWWRNLCPRRKEYPRRIPEFLTLGVYEVGAGFEPPNPPDSVRAHHFRHHRRPGQGSLSGKPTRGLELVLISPKTPSGAEALRDWADFVHIRQIAASAVPGFTMITPYENASKQEPRFMHFYEMDTPEAEEAFQRMTPTTEKRVGAQGSADWKEWATHPEFVIDYVNTFTFVGEAKS